MAASVWKGHLIFGMVSFPIRLFSAARSETISFNLLHKDDHSRIHIHNDKVAPGYKLDRGDMRPRLAVETE